MKFAKKAGTQRWEGPHGVVIEFFEGLSCPYRVFVFGEGPSVDQFETFDEAVESAELALLGAVP